MYFCLHVPAVIISNNYVQVLPSFEKCANIFCVQCSIMNTLLARNRMDGFVHLCVCGVLLFVFVSHVLGDGMVGRLLCVCVCVEEYSPEFVSQQHYCDQNYKLDQLAEKIVTMMAMTVL